MKTMKRLMALLLMLGLLCGLTSCDFSDPSAIVPKPYDTANVVKPETTGQYLVRYRDPVENLSELAAILFEGKEYEYDDILDRATCNGATLNYGGNPQGNEYINLIHHKKMSTHASAQPWGIFGLSRNEAGLAFLNSLAEQPKRDKAYQYTVELAERAMKASGLTEYQMRFSGKFSAKDAKQIWIEYCQREFGQEHNGNINLAFEDVYVVMYDVTPTEAPEYIRSYLKDEYLDTTAFFIYDGEELTYACIPCIPTLEKITEWEMEYTMEEAMERAIAWCGRDDMILVDAFYGLHHLNSAPVINGATVYDGYWTFKFVVPALLSELPVREAELLKGLGIRGQYKVRTVRVGASNGLVRLGAWKYYSTME